MNDGPLFQIGSTVWIAAANQTEKWINCPDCFGTLTLKVTLGDGTELIIPCAGCTIGYDPPKGIVRTYEFVGRIEFRQITGIHVNEGGKIEYSTHHYCSSESNVFATQEEAEKRAAELVAEYEAEEAARMQRKEKPTRSWAWHVHYHRGIIRRAQADIERSTILLGIAQSKRKDEVRHE